MWATLKSMPPPPSPLPDPHPTGCPALLSSTHSPVTTDLGGDTWTLVTRGPKARGHLQWQSHLGMKGQVNSLRAAFSCSSGHLLCPQGRMARGMSYTDVWALVIALAARSDLEIIRLGNVDLITQNGPQGWCYLSLCLSPRFCDLRETY